MQTSNRLFDDIARIAGGAFQTITGLREEVELRVKERVERMLADLDLVTREEHDATKAMAAKARSEQEKLNQKVAGLEREIAAMKGGKPAARPRRTPSRPRKSKPAEATG